MSECPNYKECFHEPCVTGSYCSNGDFWGRYWKGRTEKNLRKTDPGPRPAKVGKKKAKADLIELGCSKNPVRGMKKCEIRNKNCHLSKICGIMAECVLSHSRTLERPDLIPALKDAASARKAMRILEEIMPSLKRYNDSANFRRENKSEYSHLIEGQP